MQVLNIHGVGDLRLDVAEPPMPGSRDVVVRVHACGICGSDLSFVKWGGPRPGQGVTPIGHEFSGEIVRIGRDVQGVREGQRVVVNPMTTPGPLGNGGPEGAFTQEVLIREATIGGNLFPIPDDIPSDLAALTEPLAVSLHGVVRSGAVPGERVAVFGCGPIGLGVVLWLADRGVTDIVAIDLSPERLARAKALGAAHVIDAGREDVAERLAAIHGRGKVYSRDVAGTDLLIDAAGSKELLGRIVAMARRHARLMVLAAYPGEVPLNLAHLLAGEITLLTALAYPTEIPEVIAALPRIRGHAEALISHRFPLADALAAFETARSPASAKVLIEMEPA